MPQLPTTPHATVPPDWVGEVLSLSTAGVDRLRKMPIYLNEGVTHLWLVDPGLRTVEVFRNEGARWVLLANHVGDQVARIEPFEAHEFDLQSLWADEGETPAE